jgi:septum formation protein
MNLPYPIILASNSPRRQELLRNAGISFSVRVKETDEQFPATMPVVEVARFLADKKAEAFRDELMDELIITADTTVVLRDEVLNKPANANEAASMLQRLSGTSHKVITGVCLLHRKQKVSFDDTTVVYFRQLEKEEIDYYIAHYKPFDKAGSYGIQEWIGMIGIEKIEGSYYNVMGLPVEKLYNYLKQLKHDF